MQNATVRAAASVVIVLGAFVAASSAEMVPRVQRFAQRDPRGFRDGTSRYVYLRGCASCGLDPSGLARCDTPASTFCTGVCGAVGNPPAVTLCKDGLKCHCMCPAGIRGAGVTEPVAGLIVRKCLDVHEGHHVNNSDITCCGPDVGGWQHACWPPKDENNNDECAANIEECDCIRVKINDCVNSPRCKDCLDQLLSYVRASQCPSDCPGSLQEACRFKKGQTANELEHARRCCK